MEIKLKKNRYYLFWAIEKSSDKENILKTFLNKKERDNWVKENKNREKIASNSPLVNKAKRGYVFDSPCEIEWEE